MLKRSAYFIQVCRDLEALFAVAAELAIPR